MKRIKLVVDTTPEETVSAIRHIIIGSILAEYGCRMLVDGVRFELKQKVNLLLNATRGVQNHYLYHPGATPETKETFSREFLKGEIVLIGELLTTVWGLSETDLEEVINQIKNNTDHGKNITEEESIQRSGNGAYFNERREEVGEYGD